MATFCRYSVQTIQGQSVAAFPGRGLRTLDAFRQRYRAKPALSLAGWKASCIFRGVVPATYKANEPERICSDRDAIIPSANPLPSISPMTFTDNIRTLPRRSSRAILPTPKALKYSGPLQQDFGRGQRACFQRLIQAILVYLEEVFLSLFGLTCP